MSDDEKNLPARVTEGRPVSVRPTEQPTTVSRMPRPSVLTSTVHRWEHQAALASEVVQTEREQNNTRYIQAQTNSRVAQHRLENIRGELDIIDASLETELAQIHANGARAVEEANAVISEFERVRAENEAGKSEAVLRKERADAEIAKLRDKAGGNQDQVAHYEKMKQDLRVQLIACEDAIKQYNSPDSDDDETAIGQLREARALKAEIQERLQKVGRKLDSLLGLD
ncbi:hypothetical protein [uncultured Tateyamaria sp.]|uniref:hypothetical protein n=1 Tax=uncultured Tateyamaria sp. TaxID=455651 RepID=UPI00260BDAEA|nr:hypothetical protein [uncultured Tateyamaria sp.]